MATFPLYLGGEGARLGGALDQGTVLDESAFDIQGDLGRLSQAFQSLAFHPPNGERLLGKTFQPIISFDGTNQFKLRQIGLKIKPITRRPG